MIKTAQTGKYIRCRRHILTGAEPEHLPGTLSGKISIGKPTSGENCLQGIQIGCFSIQCLLTSSH